jgi:hypothetical protein
MGVVIFRGAEITVPAFAGTVFSSFSGETARGIFILTRRSPSSYFFLAAFFLAFFLAFAMRVLQLQVSPGIEYIHALPKYKQGVSDVASRQLPIDASTTSLLNGHHSHE